MYFTSLTNILLLAPLGTPPWPKRQWLTLLIKRYLYLASHETMQDTAYWYCYRQATNQTYGLLGYYTVSYLLWQLITIYT
jgi:hypothetical protein